MLEIQCTNKSLNKNSYVTMCQLFVLRIVTWSSNCLLRIIISYLKADNCVPIICIKNSYLKL